MEQRRLGGQGLTVSALGLGCMGMTWAYSGGGDAAEADERAVLVTEGEASLDGDRLEPFTLYVMAPGQAMTLRAEVPSRIMLLGGEAFATQRHVFWNFVSSSRDRINQAKEDWKARRFPLVPGDEEEFIPLPEG